MPAVIDKKKQDKDYEEHKRIVKTRAQNTRKVHNLNDMRDSSIYFLILGLRQFYESAERLTTRLRTMQSLSGSRTVFVLVINNLQLNHPSLASLDIVLKMNLQGRKNTQNT